MGIAAKPSRTERVVSLIELIIGGLIVIGHNIFHKIPNEVPILLIIGWISLRWRNSGWKSVGLVRPKSCWKLIGLAIAGAVVLQVGSELVLYPLVAKIWPEPQKISTIFQSQPGDWKRALITLAIAWIFAAFGEELDYRGYLLRRVADVGGGSALAYWSAVIVVAVLFGFAHYYKGPAGVIDSAYSGLVMGGVYLVAGRNLWAPILAHGFADTIAVAAVFAGWAA